MSESESNRQLVELVKNLLDLEYREVMKDLYFRGPAGPIDDVAFDGSTVSGKRFFGQIQLAEDIFQLVHEIQIQIGGRYGLFSYCPESDPPFHLE